MPRWPEQDGLEVRRLDGFVADGPVSDDAAVTFSPRVAASPPGAGEEVMLALDGIATVFEVVLNGVVVAEGSSMFAAHTVDVGTLLRGEGNDLEIRCRALSDVLAQQPRRPRQRWRTKVVENGGALRFVRTAILGRAPGFAPGPPIVGPWRPVWLVRRAGVVVDDVVLRPRIEGDDGVLAVSARVRGGILPAQVEAFVGAAHAPLRVEPDGRVHGEVRVAEAERWWPRTHGVPALYDVALVLDGGAQRVDLGATGFRVLSPARRSTPTATRWCWRSTVWRSSRAARSGRRCPKTRSCPRCERCATRASTWCGSPASACPRPPRSTTRATSWG